jgi:serine/threonine-protein kinase
VVYNLFQRRARSEAVATEFAATVVSPPEEFAARHLAAPASPGLEAPGGPPSDLGADSLPAPAQEAAVERRPTLSHIGRYALKGLLGEGGLGQVHEAWDPLLSRTVAVKVLQFDLDKLSRLSLKSLFLNEARAAAGLSHPHIVTVHDAGLSSHGVYIAMERLRGSDLRQRLASGWQPTPGQAAQLVRRVADALAYAHSRGVVHCDIKPGNIFLCKGDKPKVLDFGIARMVRRSSLKAAPAAAAGGTASKTGAAGPAGPAQDFVIGSPHYLAPEQLQGGELDARTDIHALGVVFYELLTLRKAFQGDSVEQITAAVLAQPPAPAHEARAGVPRTLAAIAERAMAQEPSARYASAADMATELRRWIDRNLSAEGLAGASASSASPSGHSGVSGHSGHSGHSAQPAWSGVERRRPASGAATGGASKAHRVAPLALGLTALAGLALLGGGLLMQLRASDAGEAQAPPVLHRVTMAAPTQAWAATVESLTASASATAGASAAASAAASEAASAAAASSPASAAASAPGSLESGTAPPAPEAPRPGALHRTPRAKPRSAPAPAQTAAPAVVAAPALGSVNLAISPWGQVEVDGAPAGITPPLTHLDLREGSHRLTVRNADFPPYTVTVQVSADKPVTLHHHFGQ